MTTLQLSLLPPDNSTSSPPVSPAKTFQVPTPTGEDWKVNEAGCSLKLSESFAQFNPDSYCLKTYQLSLTGDLTEFSGKLPKAGLMRNGKLFQRQAWERLTKGNGFSSLPTPRAQEPGRTRLGYGRGLRELMEGRTQLLPTPKAQDCKHSPSNALNNQANGYQMHLPHAVGLLPTPKAMDGDRGSVGTITRFNNATGRKALKSAIGNLQPDPNQVKGQLNPEFVEWMQGYPLGWTDITLPPSPPESPTTKNA
jgi:hypothetical protein